MLTVFPEKFPENISGKIFRIFLCSLGDFGYICSTEKTYRDMIQIVDLRGGMYCPHCGTEVKGEDFVSEDRFRCVVCGMESDTDEAADDTGEGADHNRMTLGMFCSSIL